MKTVCLVLSALVVSPWATAATISGSLVDGGGLDDVQVVVRAADGRRVAAYCTDRCGDWFVDEDEGSRLRKSLKNKAVVMHYELEANRGRIAGPGPDDRLTFVKRIEFAR